MTTLSIEEISAAANRLAFGPVFVRRVMGRNGLVIQADAIACSANLDPIDWEMTLPEFTDRILAPMVHSVETHR